MVEFEEVSQSPKIIELINASVVQADKEVLSEVNLAINPSEFVFLTGKTGSGKMSLRGACAGAGWYYPRFRGTAGRSKLARHGECYF